MIHGIGIDIVKTGRLAEKNANQLDMLAQRILTKSELAEYDVIAVSLQDRISWLAKRWAVKEATRKALGATKEFDMNRIEVMHLDNGGPYLCIDGRSSNIPEGFEYHVSISDERDIAVAMVIIEREER